MRIDLAFPKLPPAFDGIGDHTARLAAALAQGGANVRVLTAQPNALPIEGVRVETAFEMGSARGLRALLPAIEHDPPDWIVLQYNPFSWGRWGWAPFLPFAMLALRRSFPRTRLALMVHEPFVRARTARYAVMTLWQRWQLWTLGRLSSALFVSIEAWAKELQGWFPGTPVHHLPVGSNITHLGVARHDARHQLGIDEDQVVLGVFGCAGYVRLLPFIASAARAVQQQMGKALLLYVGGHGDEVRAAANGVPVRDAGKLPEEDVSVHFSAMDLYLSPFVDGVSTRRGSFLVGLQHGLPSVGTDGHLTDTVLRAADGEAFLLAGVDNPAAFDRHVLELAGDADRRERLGQAAQAFYEMHFAWAHLARTMREHLEALGGRP